MSNGKWAILTALILLNGASGYCQQIDEIDGYLPKGEYNQTSTITTQVTYSEVLYEANAEVMSDTWQTEDFQLINGTFSTGIYDANQSFHAFSPSFSLPIRRTGTHIYLRIDSKIHSESWHDVARIRVIDVLTGESTDVYSNYGTKERSVEYIQLDYYAGTNIRFEFSFSSDSTYHGDGWSLYEVSVVGDNLQQTNVTPLRRKLSKYGTRTIDGDEEGTNLETDIPTTNGNDLDVTNPYINLNINIMGVSYKDNDQNNGTISFTMTDSNGNYFTPEDIDTSHFIIKINQQEVPICGKIRHNQNNNVDVVVALDCSGSMGTANNNLKNTIPTLIDQLKNFNTNLAPVRFGADCKLNQDNFEFGEFVSAQDNSSNFITPATNFGNWEMYYYTLMKIANTEKNYTDNSQKVIIMIGDESYNSPNNKCYNNTDKNGVIISCDTVVKYLQMKSFQTFIINEPNNAAGFNNIWQKTHGKYINLNNGNFNQEEIINAISSSLNARCYVDFCSNQTYNCNDTLIVSMEIKDSHKADETPSLVEYMPLIERTSKTQGYDNNGWKSCPDNIPIEFFVSNYCLNDSVNSANVFYSINGSPSFTKISAHDTIIDNKNAYVAYIPSDNSIWKIDYRISVQMKNGRFIATSPQVTNTIGDTWTIPVCCSNNCIPLPSVMDVTWNCDSVIQVAVRNAQNLDNLQVYFLYNNEFKENVSAAQYTYVPLQLTNYTDNGDKRVYSAAVPDDIQNKHIVYHIYMTDGNYKMWYGNGNETNKDMEVDVENCNPLCENFRLSSNPITSSSDSVCFTLKKQTMIKFVLTDDQGKLIRQKEIMETQENVEIKHSLLKEVFDDLNPRDLDPLKPYILTITDGKKAVMTYLYVSRL